MTNTILTQEPSAYPVTTTPESYAGSATYVGDAYYLLLTLDSIGDDTGNIYMQQGTFELTEDLTIPANVRLLTENGTIFEVATGVTLTINGPLVAGLYQIFDCVGTGAVVFGAGGVQEVYPEWWTDNAVPGTTDMTTALLAANLAAYNAGAKVKLAGTSYLMTDVYPLRTGLVTEGVSKDSTILINATDATFVRSYSDNPEVLANTVYRAVLSDLRLKTTDETNTQTGLNLNGCDDTLVFNVAIENFQYGVKLERTTLAGVAHSTTQCYFNHLENVYIYEAETGISFGDTAASANNNKFTNIRINGGSTNWTDWTGVRLMGYGNSFVNLYVGGGYPKYGIYIGGTNVTVGDNTFVNVYLESLANSADSYGVYTKDIQSRTNYFYGVRFDGTPQGGYYYDAKSQLTVNSTLLNQVSNPVSSTQNVGIDIVGNSAYGGANVKTFGLMSGSGKVDSDGKAVPIGSFGIKNRTEASLPFEIEKTALDDGFKLTATGRKIGTKYSGSVEYKIFDVASDITAAASVTIAAAIPANAIIDHVQLRVDTALTAGELWDAAYSGGSTQAIATAQAVAKNTKVAKWFDTNAATAITTNTTNIAITKNGGGSFTAAGNIRAVGGYWKINAVADAD